MQLKRDTDYAMRILFCLNERYASARTEEDALLSLQDISTLSEVPKTTTRRLCKRLSDAGILLRAREHEGKEALYCIDKPLSSFSLLSLINAIEGTGRIFAVFDPRSSMYQRRTGAIDTVQGQVEQLLQSVALSDLLDEQARP